MEISKLPWISSTGGIHRAAALADQILLLLPSSCPIESSGSEGESVIEHPSDKWLFAVAQATMDTYVKSIQQIPKLNENASQQLSTDIGTCRERERKKCGMCIIMKVL